MLVSMWFEFSGPCGVVSCHAHRMRGLYVARGSEHASSYHVVIGFLVSALLGWVSLVGFVYLWVVSEVLRRILSRDA